MSQLTVAIACDHAGFPIKSILKTELEQSDHQVIDLGTHSQDSVDYPDFGFALASALGKNEADFGVLVCGSGIGISIAVNRFDWIRAALVSEVTSARLCREHNDANVLALGQRLTGIAVALDCVDIFMATAFEGGRHQSRVDKLGGLNGSHD